MAQAVVILRDGALIYQTQGRPRTILLETPEWEHWLINASTFMVEHEQGVFTARKERAGNRRGGVYWRAYVQRNGLRHRVYIGKTEALTLTQLREVAARLAQRELLWSRQRGPVSVERAVVRPRGEPFTRLAGSAVRRKRPRQQIRYPLLLTTKLSIPPVPAHIVVRSRLLERLQQITQRPLTLVSAPAGSGKTTLLSEWCTLTVHAHSERETEERAAQAEPTLPGSVPSPLVTWLSLDESENDPTAFWHYVIAALERLQPEIGNTALALLFSTEPPPIHAILTVFINALTAPPRPVVLVLDDYHLIETPAIHETLAFFLAHMPAHMHLVLASRNEPSLPLARLRAHLRLDEIGPAELRFTVEETTTFFNTGAERHLSEEVIAALDERLEGWIVGLQLVTLALRGREESVCLVEELLDSSLLHHHIFEYLTGEVLDHQSEQVKTFLLHTSILDRLHAPLCDALMEQADSQKMLRLLEQRRLFIVPLDNQGEWYRYHHLFLEVLRRSLQWLYPERQPALHRRASMWYEQYGSMYKAITHALKASAFERAADLIEQEARTSGTLWMRSEFARLRSWLEALPATVVRQRPLLCILFACVLYLPELPSTADALKQITDHLQNAERSLLAKGAEPEYQEMQGAQAALSAAIAYMQGNIVQAIDRGQQALDLLPPWNISLRVLATQTLSNAYRFEGNMHAAHRMLGKLVTTSQSSRDIYGALQALSNLGISQTTQGELHQAASSYRRAFRLAEQVGIPCVPAVSIGWGTVLLEWNEVEQARSHILQGLEQAKIRKRPDMEIFGYQMLAYIHWAQGAIDEAFAALLEIERVVQDHQILSQSALTSSLPILLAATRARLSLAKNDLHAANRWAATCQPPRHEPMTRFRMLELSVLARVRLANHQPGEALLLLEMLLSIAEKTQNVESLLSTLLLQALAFSAQGEKARATAALARVLCMTEPQGYIRLYVKEGEPMRALLREFLAAQPARVALISPRYVRKILAAFGQREAAAEAASTLLSSREREIIRLMAQGYSDREIAHQLVLAESTVKTYAKRVYAKLNAKNRTQAVMYAQEMHVL